MKKFFQISSWIGLIYAFPFILFAEDFMVHATLGLTWALLSRFLYELGD